MNDSLIEGLMAAVGKKVEVFAFGITYIGELKSVDPDNGFIIISDGIDTVQLELERIESFSYE